MRFFLAFAFVATILAFTLAAPGDVLGATNIASHDILMKGDHNEAKTLVEVSQVAAGLTGGADILSGGDTGITSVVQKAIGAAGVLGG